MRTWTIPVLWATLAFPSGLLTSAPAQEPSTSKPRPSRPSGAEAERRRRLRRIDKRIHEIRALTERNERLMRKNPQQKDELLRENEQLARERERLLAEKIALQENSGVQEVGTPPDARSAPRAPEGGGSKRNARKVRPKPLDLLRQIVRKKRSTAREGGG